MKAKRLDDYHFFISDIIDIYKKYGFSIGWDKDTENISIEEFKDSNVDWLKDCEVSPVIIEKMMLGKNE